MWAGCNADLSIAPVSLCIFGLISNEVCMHKIENMPLQPSSIFSCPWQMSQCACFPSKILCVVSILIGNHVHVKRLGIVSGVPNASRPGSAKFTNAPPPALTWRANTNPETFPKESLQLRLGNLSSTSNSSFCYSWMVCLLGFWLKNAPLIKVENPILDGIVFVFHLAWCVRGLHSLEWLWPYLIVISF